VFSIVKLLNNYRSHPAIIHYPSERFYDGELEARGDPSSINSCLNLEPLVRKKYPVIFCGVEGQDLREATSPSFFNIEEVLQVKAYVQQLLADTRAEPRIGKFFLLSLKIDSQSSQRGCADRNHRAIPRAMHEASQGFKADCS
jgi:hypothetical protein